MDHQQTQPEDSIQVVVRIKPGSQEQAVVYTPNQIQLEKHTFAFDRVFPPEAQQEDIFHAVGKKLLMNTLEGYNSCIFAYGQTGSGKTYTMMGNNNGLMQRSFNELFSRLNRLSESECIVTCSYYQLYNEQINDLLDTRKEKKNLSIRQDVRKGVFVENLTEQSALCAQKLTECLNTGMRNRHIGQTMMNRQSSRSHSIFTISLAIKSEVDGKKILKTPKLHFVDLAGSQRQKMTNASGQRLKQAGNINKSLTTLGMVINSLASDKAKTHIPYRDSKLTCLLRDSLGGNSKTFIVATISTSILCFQETLSTLNFANRAKMVKVKALINEESLSTNIQQFKEEIRKLKQQISRLKSEKRVTIDTPPTIESVISKNNGDLQCKFSELTSKIEDLKSNMGNSNVDDVLRFLNRTKDQDMHDEGQEKMEEQGNQLIKYMLSNHELLKKIHQAVNDYTSLREEIKSVQFSRRMPLEDIKTPSKFERDQYEDLVEKRQTEIKILQERVASLKEVNLNKEVEIRELRRKVTSMEDHTESKEESLARLLYNQEDLEKRHSELSLRHELVREQKLRIEKSVEELEGRMKEFKQLYHYAEEKYENERNMRSKLETSIRELNKKIHTLEQEKKQVIEDYENKIYQIEEKYLQTERREQQLRSQIEVLNETVEFDRKKMKEYSDKVTENSRLVQELTQTKYQLGQQVTLLEHQKQQLTNHYEHLVGELKLKNRDIENNRQLLRDQLSKAQYQNSSLQNEYESLRQSSKVNIDKLEADLQNQKEISKTVSTQLEQFKISHQKTVLNLEASQFQMEKLFQNTSKSLQIEREAKQLLQQKYQSEQQFYSQEMQKLTYKNQNLAKDVSSLTEQAQTKDKRISELELHVQSTKNVVEEYQQLKKTYKEVIKENYKLKGEYISSSSSSLSEAAKNQELISKVAYYQEKFRLMSIEYNKVQEVGKKLKQKQLTLIKKLEYYEESEKVKRLQNSSDHEEAKGESVKMLQLENSQLKESLSKLSKMYETKIHSQKKEDYSKRVNLEHFKYELELKEQKIRKKLENAIKNWDHAKENNCSGMHLDDLFSCWEKLENQSRKKIEGISRSIKRQQKLKVQNGFIIKENAYLKERVEALERQINLSVLCQPRKIVKLDTQE